MGIENFISDRKVVEDMLDKRDCSDQACELFISVAKQAEQIVATNINKPGYTPADMKAFLITIYNGVKRYAIQKRNTEMVKEYNTKIATLEN